jgi:predicted nucleic acid-binding protein
MSRVLLDTSAYAPNDLWIAASAAQHGLRIATLDGDFERIPHVVVDRYEPLDG